MYGGVKVCGYVQLATSVSFVCEECVCVCVLTRACGEREIDGDVYLHKTQDKKGD